jgi:transcription factor SPN1
MSDTGSPAGSPAPADSGERREEENHVEADAHDNGEQPQTQDGDDGGDLSDKDSDLLSEIDEDQFDDYAPVTIDESVTKTLKAAKRKRTDGDAAPKKPKEGRRAKKRARSEDDLDDGGDYGGERRPRKVRTNNNADRPSKEQLESDKRAREKEEEENMTPEERRRRALERAMDAAIKNPSKRRRKKDEVDLEDEIDEQIASLKVRMERACVADNDAREAGQPAVHKLKLLPEVTALLNRNTVQDAVLDPETNFLQSIKYFLEPLNDGSLPAYNIQRDIFTALTKLPIEKEALLSSGIGKVVLFYTRSKRPEVGIKRMAERLLGEWSRPILKRTDDYKKRHVETREFDYSYVFSFSPVHPLHSVVLTPSPEPQNWPSAHQQWVSSPSPPARPARSPAPAKANAPATTPSASAPLLPSTTPTVPVRLVCPPVTPLPRRVHSTPRLADSRDSRITDLLVLEERRLSGG